MALTSEVNRDSELLPPLAVARLVTARSTGIAFRGYMIVNLANYPLCY